MSAPEFLIQTPKQKYRDKKLLAKLAEDAQARKVVPTKQSLLLDHLERAIEETKRHLRETDNVGAAELAGRLDFLRQEKERLISQK
jgi:hypothetical protein